MIVPPATPLETFSSLADMKGGLTTEADLRRLYEELEACRLEELRSGQNSGENPVSGRLRELRGAL